MKHHPRTLPSVQLIPEPDFAQCSIPQLLEEGMRHSSPVLTLGTYAKAVTADKRLAQDAIAALFVGKTGDTATAHAS
jgi:hypothetical protein